MIQIYIDIVFYSSSANIPPFIMFFLSLFTTKHNLLIVAAIFYIIISIIQHIFSTLSVYVSQNLAWTSTNNLRNDLAKHCISLDMSFHNKYKPGEMIERIDGDVVNLANFFSLFSIQLISSFLIIIGVSIVLYLEHWIIGLVFTGFVISSIFFVYFIRNVAVSKAKKLREAETDIFGFIEETLSGLEDISGNNLIANKMNIHYNKSRQMYRTSLKALIFNRIFRAVTFGLGVLCLILVFMPGIPLFNRGIITYGVLFEIFIYTDLIKQPIFQIVNQFQDLQKTTACIIRIEELLNKKSKIDDSGILPFPEKPLSLTFDDIEFSYVKNENVLNKLSFKIKPETSLGLLGNTGCGKTTISRLIFRFYEPQSGTIKINDVDIEKIALNELRKNISYVTQNIEIFQASLRDNITLFDLNVSDEQILAVIEELQLNKWLDSLPDGLDTFLDSGDKGLSAGESQLLALTRAFLKDPAIIILDEASSRLDPATEHLIERAINTLIQGRVSMIIAHRLSTLDKADDILILTKGSVLEYGSRKNLLKKSNSLFNKLLKLNQEEVVI